MQDKEKLIEIEKSLDKDLLNLMLWQLPFQSILSSALLTIDNVALNGRPDTAIDYASRLSYIYSTITSKAQKAEIINTTDAMAVMDEQWVPDMTFLNSYAHFCILMPQVHREVYTVRQVAEKEFELMYASKQTTEAEIMDRIYSYLSLQMAPGFSDPFLSLWLEEKVASGETSLGGTDFCWIKCIHDHFLRHHFAIQVLPSPVLAQVIGATNEEYYAFVSAIRAHCLYFNMLARSYFSAGAEQQEKGRKEVLISEYMEWATCCLNYKTLSWFIAISGLSIQKFDSLLSYFLSVYSNDTGEPFQSQAACGDGYFPPFILAEKSVIYSSLGAPLFLNQNNLLYSINKRNKKKFDEEISEHLEPTLINQLEYIFSHLPGIKFERNVNYPSGEIDLLILQESENASLALQVKATMAPDSFRTVDRVEGRALEGMKQIEMFSKLDSTTKDSIINKAFGTTLKKIEVISILAVRSSAGSAKAWLYDPVARIINYTILVQVIAQKIETGNLSIRTLSNDIVAVRERLLKLADIKDQQLTISIGDVKIAFQNVDIDMSKLTPLNTKARRLFPLMEKANFKYQ